MDPRRAGPLRARVVIIGKVMSTKDKFARALEEALDVAAGRACGIETTVVPEFIDVKSIRDNLKLSQHEFSLRFGFPVGTVRNWEQNRRHPEGAARLLLKIIAKRPDIVDEILREEDEDFSNMETYRESLEKGRFDSCQL